MNRVDVEERVEEDLESKGDIQDIESKIQTDSLSNEERLLGASQNELIENTKKKYSFLNKIFSIKEFLDRLGYGFGAHQWITIFFFLIGANAFLVGIINALRDVLGDFISSFINVYSKVKTMSKNVLSFAGIFFGFSFLGLVLGISTKSVTIYALSIIFGSVGIVTYGQIYTQLLDQEIRNERKARFLKEVAHYGVLITAIAFVLSGWALEQFPSGTTVAFFGVSVPLTGYFLIFELTAIMFILSGFILSKVSTREINEQDYPFIDFVKEYFNNLNANRKLFFKNNMMTLLFFASLFVSVVQSLGASFYGYYIYTLLKDYFFGGFLNVAIIFGVAILASFLGPILTRYVQRKVGLAPMFVFGTLLLTFLPLILLYNKSFYPILVASSLAIIGATIIGMAQGLLTRKLLSLSERKAFYSSLRHLSALPFLLLAGLGALIASIYSFELIFKLIIGTLLFLVTPIYFILVLKSNKKRRF